MTISSPLVQILGDSVYSNHFDFPSDAQYWVLGPRKAVQPKNHLCQDWMHLKACLTGNAISVIIS